VTIAALKWTLMGALVLYTVTMTTGTANRTRVRW
jgi:hypothetical protein